jgi:hypothetical protein
MHGVELRIHHHANVMDCRVSPFHGGPAMTEARQQLLTSNARRDANTSGHSANIGR